MRLWANATGHDDLTAEPAAQEVEELLEYMDLLFDTIYAQPEKLAALAKKRAERKREG